MSERKNPYPFDVFEPRWQAVWDEEKTFKVLNPGEEGFDAAKPKYYVLDMFPYPSGAGLHVGHPEGYTATDIVSRYKRMNGYNVLHPMGWDSFGLPAEQYAIKTGQHPSITTYANIDNFRRQLKMLGFSYDWDREVATTDPGYVKWTQWIFLRLYNSYYNEQLKKACPITELEAKGWTREQIDNVRLAYVAEGMVNWSPDMGTVLANEEAEEWKSKGFTVERRKLRQWMLRITAYAERLIDELEPLDWPESIKLLQRNWIGKSSGAEVNFSCQGNTITVYTTRPDTLFGATYMVLAPEHELVNSITTPEQKAAVEAYQTACAAKSDLERTELTKEKTGVFTGAYAINPVNGKEIPIWIADYVLTGYGTGAIMAVPAHDSRDYEFAVTFGLPITQVVQPDNADTPWQNFCGYDGTMVNSEHLNGLSVPEAKKQMTAWLEEKGYGCGKVNYKLRDWLFSRQRYWGEPFPVILMEDGSIRLEDEANLPVQLPDLTDFKPSGTGESPLAKAEEWLNYTDPVTGMKGRRETNTMPQWAGSCWYYLRYIDPTNDKMFIDPEKEKYWMPVDLYVGGAEHAVLHLLYARFWHKVLFDIGAVSTPEPFRRLINQGMILGMSYKNARGVIIPNDKVESRDDGNYYDKESGEKLTPFPAKMSKSLRNVVNPDDVIRDYGADSMRLYEMFMGPLEAVKPWNTNGVEGVFRFLKRIWRMIAETPIADVELTKEQLKLLHATIKKVTEDTETLNFNTAISQMMIFVNEFSKLDAMPRAAAEPFVKLIAPYAPHIAEELWEILGNAAPVSLAEWPVFDPKFLVEDSVEILVQVNGKPRARIMMSVNADAAEMEKLAMSDENVIRQLEGKQVMKVICVPKRVVNIVAK